MARRARSDSVVFTGLPVDEVTKLLNTMAIQNRDISSIIGIGFSPCPLDATVPHASMLASNSVSRCSAALLCSHSIFGVGLRHARSMRLCATCIYAGVNSVSRCSAALLCSHWLSEASAFAVPARCDCVPHASMLASTASRAAGLHFCAVAGYLRRRLSPCPLDATVPNASMLASTASRVAGLHLRAVSAYHRRRLSSVALLDRCGAKACFYAGVAHHLSRCSAIDPR